MTITKQGNSFLQHSRAPPQQLLRKGARQKCYLIQARLETYFDVIHTHADTMTTRLEAAIPIPVPTRYGSLGFSSCYKIALEMDLDDIDCGSISSKTRQ